MMKLIIGYKYVRGKSESYNSFIKYFHMLLINKRNYALPTYVPEVFMFSRYNFMSNLL